MCIYLVDLNVFEYNRASIFNFIQREKEHEKHVNCIHTIGAFDSSAPNK